MGRCVGAADRGDGRTRTGQGQCPRVLGGRRRPPSHRSGALWLASTARRWLFVRHLYSGRARSPPGRVPGGLKPKLMIAAGQSQSAFALVTYYDGVQPLTHVFNGFFVHSRGAAGLPLVGPGQSADIAGSIGKAPTLFRTDLPAPVMDVQSESDITSILNSYAARQPDSGAIPALGGRGHRSRRRPSARRGRPLPPLRRSDQQRSDARRGQGRVPRAHDLGEDRTGAAPRAARPGDLSGTPQIVRSADGIALGGVRTPPVDVPVEALSGTPGPNPSTICLLLGSAPPALIHPS